jgi:hypothetical protein
LLELRRGNKEEIGKVVESSARIVGRKQRSEVYRFGQIVKREQVADRVPIFSTSEAVEGWQLADVRICCGPVVEVRFQL